MTFPSSADRLLNQRRRRGKLGKNSRRRKPEYRPLIDHLEQRNLLTTFTVISEADDGAGSLRQAILDANASPGPDTIKFDRDIQEISLTSGQLLITDDLTIRGPGADKLTIDGSTIDRVFAVVPEAFADKGDLFAPPTSSDFSDVPSLRIERLSIENGLAGNAIGYPVTEGFAFGGGIYNMGGFLHLERVHMSGNVAAGGLAAGGAVANEFGGTLTVSRSHFETNSSLGFVVAVGGAITSDSGATADGPTDSPVVHVDRSHFDGNLAQTTTGYVDAPDAAFSGVAGGGAILNVTGDLTISRSHFENNSVQGGNASDAIPDVIPASTSGGAGIGGAVLSGNLSPFALAQSTLHISRSTFENNSAYGGSGESQGVAGGLASGGAVAVGNGSDAKLERNHFEGNSVEGGAGSEGGIGTGGAASAADTAQLRLERNRFTENSAKGGVGAISDGAGRGGAVGLDTIEQFGFGKTEIELPDGRVIMPFAGPATASSKFDTFEGNTAYGGIGGGIYNEGELSIKGSTLSGNKAEGQKNTRIEFVPGYTFVGAGLGGGISNLGSLNMKLVSFESNEATGADDSEGPNITFFEPFTVFPDYPGLAVGGGLHNIGVAKVENGRFLSNEANAGHNNVGTFAGVANGGGIYNDNELTIIRSSVHGNRAIGGNGNGGDLNAGGGYGGGLASGSVTEIARIKELPVDFEPRSATLRAEKISVHSNEASGGDGNTGVLPFEVPDAHKPAAGIGGGIAVYQGEAQINKAKIYENLAAGGEGGLGAGGGVFFFGFVGSVNAELSSSLVAHNTARGGDGADGLGGGIATGSLGSIFSLGLLSERPDPDLTNVMVTINRTNVNTNVAIGGDERDGLGGGIYNGSTADTELVRSLVFANRARGGSNGEGIGGGVFNDGEFEEIRSRIFANWASTSDDDCADC
jgi:hypothetical protein